MSKHEDRMFKVVGLENRRFTTKQIGGKKGVYVHNRTVRNQLNEMKFREKPNENMH